MQRTLAFILVLQGFAGVSAAEPTLQAHTLAPAYDPGARFTLGVLLLEDGAPVPNATITVTLSAETFTLYSSTLVTDASGHAFVILDPPADVTNLTYEATWTASNASVLRAAGTVVFRDRVGELLTEAANTSEQFADVRLKGVHLDELGSRHIFLASVRAAGTVALVILLVLFVIYVAIRV